MRLRDYRAALASPERAKGLGLKLRIAGAAALALVLIAGGAALALKGRSAAVPTDGKTLCPTRRPPSEIMVILLDVSSRFSEPQRLQIQNQLARLRDSVPRFGLVEVYTVDRLRRRLTEPINHLCNPGTGAELNQMYQNPQLARKKWDGFAAKLRTDINHQIEAPAHATGVRADAPVGGLDLALEQVELVEQVSHLEGHLGLELGHRDRSGGGSLQLLGLRLAEPRLPDLAGACSGHGVLIAEPRE